MILPLPGLELPNALINQETRRNVLKKDDKQTDQNADAAPYIKSGMQIVFAGQTLTLHPSGALYWPLADVLIASDLHLEKGSAQARRGFFLPPYDSRETLTRLLAVLNETGATRLLLLGDCFHDGRGFARLGVTERRLFDRLTAFDPIWIIGNHDGDFVPPGFTAYDQHQWHGLTFRHEAAVDAKAEISGHFHPKADLVHKGAKIARPCFIEDGHKLIVPAFGVYTGGLSVSDPAIARFFPDGGRCHVLARTRIYSFATIPVMRP